MVKSILLITNQTPCPNCQRIFTSYLYRYNLAGKLRLGSLQKAYGQQREATVPNQEFDQENDQEFSRRRPARPTGRRSASQPRRRRNAGRPVARPGGRSVVTILRRPFITDYQANLWSGVADLEPTSADNEPSAGVEEPNVQADPDNLPDGDAQQADDELEDEWYKRLAAPLLAGILTFASPKDSAFKPIVDTTKAWVQGSKDEQERRRKMKEDAEARSRQAGKTQQEFGGRLVLDEIMADEYALQQEFTAKDVIDENIDVHAQYAIQRMLKSHNLAERRDGRQMLAAVKERRLYGIYKEDQQVPAKWARGKGIAWWQLIEPGKDAATHSVKTSVSVQFPGMPPVDPLFKSTAIIVFRNSIRSNAQRLDPALRKEWQKAKQIISPPNIPPQ